MATRSSSWCILSSVDIEPALLDEEGAESDGNAEDIDSLVEGEAVHVADALMCAVNR